MENAPVLPSIKPTVNPSFTSARQVQLVPPGTNITNILCT